MLSLFLALMQNQLFYQSCFHQYQFFFNRKEARGYRCFSIVIEVDMFNNSIKVHESSSLILNTEICSIAYIIVDVTTITNTITVIPNTENV